MTLTRPEPPDLPEEAFAPAPELAAWARAAFLAEGAPFWAEDHAHLTEARIVWCWTTCEGRSKGRQIVGECALAQARGRQWAKQRDLWLVRQWWREMPDYDPEEFEGGEPDAIITLYAPWCRAAQDSSFGALCDHELYHLAHKVDGYGLPKRNQATGRPEWEIKGHDVEEHIGVVRRWGARALPEVERLLAAARKPPEIAEAAVLAGCGTCRRAA